MKLQELEQEARSLPERDRANLVLSLMETLSAIPGDEISDEEVYRREGRTWRLQGGAHVARGVRASGAG